MSKSKVTGALLVLAFTLLPVYVFSSGGPQVVDLAILALGIAALFGLAHSEIRMIGMVTMGLLVFALHTLIVNSVYFSYYHDPRFLLVSVQVFYQVFVFIVFAIAFKRLLKTDEGINYAYIAALVAALLPWVVHGKYEGIQRNALSFNDPNQLGYYSVLLYVFWSVVDYYHQFVLKNVGRRRRWQIAVGAYIVAAVHVFGMISASRAAVAALLVVDCFHIVRLLRRRFIETILTVFGFAIVGIVIFTIYDPSLNKIPIVKRFVKVNNIADLQHRTLERIQFDMSGYGITVLFGAGGSMNERFSSGTKSDPTHEVHNLFGAALRSYGLIGLIFLVAAGLIYTRSVYGIRGSIWLLGAILIFNMSHNGFRFRPFWVVLAFLLAVRSAVDERSSLEYPKVDSAFGLAGAGYPVRVEER